MEVGLFFGSFNPIHIGHLIIANVVLEFSGLEEVWFVVSPQNPFKKKRNLLHEFDRFDMVRLAIADNQKLRTTDIEFRLPKPSYTITTLAALSEKYPQHSFKILMGSDNLKYFHRWKNYQLILEEYGVLVYPRPGSSIETTNLTHKNIVPVEAPFIQISATFIRKLIKEGRSIRYLVPQAVADRIRFKKFYL